MKSLRETDMCTETTTTTLTTENMINSCSKVLHSHKNKFSKTSKVKCQICSICLCHKSTCHHNWEGDDSICNACFYAVMPFHGLDNNEIRSLFGLSLTDIKSLIHELNNVTYDYSNLDCNVNQ